MVPESPAKLSPAGRKEVAMETGHHDEVSFDPHPVEDCERYTEQGKGVSPHRREPEYLRDDDVAGDCQPEGPPVRSESPVPEYVHLIFVAAVPCCKRFDQISVGEHKTGAQHDLC